MINSSADESVKRTIKSAIVAKRKNNKEKASDQQQNISNDIQYQGVKWTLTIVDDYQVASN